MQIFFLHYTFNFVYDHPREIEAPVLTENRYRAPR
jgi:hypothetical protein